MGTGNECWEKGEEFLGRAFITGRGAEPTPPSGARAPLWPPPHTNIQFLALCPCRVGVGAPHTSANVYMDPTAPPAHLSLLSRRVSPPPSAPSALVSSALFCSKSLNVLHLNIKSYSQSSAGCTRCAALPAIGASTSPGFSNTCSIPSSPVPSNTCSPFPVFPAIGASTFLALPAIPVLSPHLLPFQQWVPRHLLPFQQFLFYSLISHLSSTRCFHISRFQQYLILPSPAFPAIPVPPSPAFPRIPVLFSHLLPFQEFLFSHLQPFQQ